MGATELELVFAYGSNMNLADLQKWMALKGYPANCFSFVATATLPGYALKWNYYSGSRKGGAANIAPYVGQPLPGLALSVTPEGLAAIDAKEGHPRYYTRGGSKMPISLSGPQPASAWVYIAVPGKCSNEPKWPRREYLQLIIEAAKEHGFPKWYIEKLTATKTFE